MHRPLRLNLLSAFMSLLLVASALLLAAPTCAHAEGTQKNIDSTMTITMQKSSDGGSASGNTTNSNDKGSTTSTSTNSKKTASTGDALPLAAAGMLVIVAGAAYCLVQSRKLSLAQGTHAAAPSRGALARQRDLSAAAKRVLSVVLATVLAASLCFGAFASKASAAEGSTEADVEASDLDAECTADVVIDEEGNVLSANITLANDSDSAFDVMEIIAPEELDGWEAAFDYFFWDEEGGSWDEADFWGDDAAYSDILSELSSTGTTELSADATLASGDDATLAADDSAATASAIAEMKSGAKATGTWSGTKVPSDVVAKVKAAGSARLGFRTIIVMKHVIVFDANAPSGTTATLDGTNVEKRMTVLDGTPLPSDKIPADSAVTCSDGDYVFMGWGTSRDASPYSAKKSAELAAANTSMGGPMVYYAMWLKPGNYWLGIAGADNPEESILKTQSEIDEDMEVLHGTKSRTSVGLDKATVASEYTNFMNGRSVDGGTAQEVRLYTRWNGAGANDGAIRWVEFRVIHVGEHDGDKSAVTFMATHSLPTGKYMNPYFNNDGGWGSTDMRNRTIGEFVSNGLKGLESAAITVTKKATAGRCAWPASTWSDSTTDDKFWLLSYSEVFGEAGYISSGWLRAEGTQYDWCAANVKNPMGSNAAIANLNYTRAGSNLGGSWWLRSPIVDNWRYFGAVNSEGSLNRHYADDTLGVIPAFCM